MKTLTLIALLTTSQFTYALSIAETDCLSRNVYHEARGLGKSDWIRVARVLLNRKAKYNAKHRFHAKSNNICDLAKSREYTSRLSKPIREIKIYREIQKAVKQVKPSGRELFFTSRHGRMHYR